GDRVMGGAKTGAMADFAVVPAGALRPIPDSLDYERAAALGAAYTTAYTALVELGDLRAGQWMLVNGASGGVSLAAIDLARHFGAKIIAATGSPEKMDRIARLYEPDAVIEAKGRFREQVTKITDGALCNLVCDPVGGDVFEESTRCVAFGGKLLVVGFAGGRIAQIATNIPLIKGFSIVGVRAGEYARRFPERGQRIANAVSELASNGSINPAIDRVLPLSQWRNGFSAMANRELVGKLILKPGA
ncbi:MAG: NADPH:quinone oxidoreductase family protein, partial [Pontixanthobacter sp.]